MLMHPFLVILLLSFEDVLPQARLGITSWKPVEATPQEGGSAPESFMQFGGQNNLTKKSKPPALSGLQFSMGSSRPPGRTKGLNDLMGGFAEKATTVRGASTTSRPLSPLRANLTHQLSFGNESDIIIA